MAIRIVLTARFPGLARRRMVLAGALAACAPAFADWVGPGQWTRASKDGMDIWVPPGETAAGVMLLRLPDQPAEADFPSQFERWRARLAQAAASRPQPQQQVLYGHAPRGDWASWAGRMEGQAGSRWWLLMARREGAQVISLLLDAADSTRLNDHARPAVEYFHSLPPLAGAVGQAPVEPPAHTPVAPTGAAALVGVWTDLPAPADTANINHERLLAANGSGTWMALRPDGTMRLVLKAPRAATAPGLTTMGGNALLVVGGDHLDGRYQEGRWHLESDELVLTFELGVHLDMIDNPAADRWATHSGGRRYPMRWTADGRLELAVMPGQWLTPLRRVAPP